MTGQADFNTARVRKVALNDYARHLICYQGLTLSKIGLNLNQREHCMSLSYVATSRATALGGIMFEASFDRTRLCLEIGSWIMFLDRHSFYDCCKTRSHDFPCLGGMQSLSL